MLPTPQSVDDHVISGPASVTASDQHEQFMTPQDSSPSMHSLSNSCHPASPSNTVVEDLSSEVSSKHDTATTPAITGITDNVTEAGLDTGGTTLTKHSPLIL